MKDIWNDYGIYKVAEMTSRDIYYQELLAECKQLEYGFNEVMHKLSENDRIKVENYIVACEDLEYRKTQLAYMLSLSIE